MNSAPWDEYLHRTTAGFISAKLTLSVVVGAVWWTLRVVTHNVLMVTKTVLLSLIHLRCLWTLYNDSTIEAVIQSLYEVLPWQSATPPQIYYHSRSMKLSNITFPIHLITLSKFPPSQKKHKQFTLRLRGPVLLRLFNYVHLHLQLLVILRWLSD